MHADRHRSPYLDACVALLTQHGKERALGPVLADGVGARLEVVRDFDTDTLGTFTRDVPRAGSQLEAARRKAEIAIERSGVEIGLGSEGAFVPGPFGLGAWDIELVVLVDRVRGIEVVGRAHAAGLHVHGAVETREELAALAERAGFPQHGLVLRPNDERDPRATKGIRDRAMLEQAFDDALGYAVNRTVFVESDLRAHMHPTRMAVIAEAGRDLVTRLACACPACGAPGFGPAVSVPGLPCADCGAPTREPLAHGFGCVRCEHREERPIAGGPTEASPAVCGYCNP
jgi:hypothetical protein